MELSDAIEDRLNFKQDLYGDPRLRTTPPPPPTHIAETWAPAELVSPVPEENALTFRTRFYIDATGQQPFQSCKVQLDVSIRRLGLSKAEEARLIAVARPHYRKRGHTLMLGCSRYLEATRNKAHLRQTVGRLLADARENAAAFEETPDSERPLAARKWPWLPRDKRAYRGRPKNHLKIFHKSPG